MRLRLFQIVGPAHSWDYASRVYDVFIVLIALLSIVPLLFHQANLSAEWDSMLNMLDICTVYILLMDYVFRWCTHDLKTNKGWTAFVIYPFTPMAIIDLLSILPSLGVLPSAFLFLRVLRVVKVFRYSRNLIVVTNACMREARTLFSVFMAVVVYMFTVALIVYTSEPEAFTNYFDAVCWACTSMTSVSFSDARPSGYLGRTLSIASSLVALLVVALPAGVITGSYINEVHDSRKTGSAYFTMTKRMDVSFKDLDSPSVWLKKNRKILRYITVIIICNVITALSYLICNIAGVYTATPMIGVALAAFLLEPMAGILVGLMICTISAFIFQMPTLIFLMFQYALTALVFGVMVPKLGAKRFAGRIALCGVVLSVGNAVLECAIAFLRAGYSFDAMYTLMSGENSFITMLSGMGVNGAGAVLLGTLLSFAIDTVLLAVLIAVLVFVFKFRAAPSEEEQRQQQKILLERALKQHEMESADARKLAKETLEKELKTLISQAEDNAKNIDLIEKRLAEINEGEAEEEALP